MDHWSLLRLLKLNSAIAFGVCLGLTFVFEALLWNSSRNFFALYTVIYGSVSLLLWRGHRLLGAWALFFAELSGIALISCLFGRESMLQIMFLLIVVFPFVYFQNEKRSLRIIAGVLPFVTFVALELSAYSWWPKEVHSMALSQWIPYGILIFAFSLQWLVMEHYGQGMHRLAKAQSLLEHEKNLSDQYLQAKNLAEKNEELKSFLLTAVSHEFRTPLHSVLLGSEFLRSKDLDHESQQCLDQMSEAAQRLSQMLGDIMDLASVRSGGIHPLLETIELGGLLEQLQQSFQMEAAALQVPLKFQGPAKVWVSTDGRRLLQLLRIVLGNALKFSPNGLIQVIWDDEGRLEIRDQGPGLHPMLIEQLGRTFVQGSGGFTRSHGGIGIGLSLALALAELLKVKMRFQNLEEGGLKVCMSFLLDDPPVVEHKEQKDSPAQNPQILIVEDQALNAKLLQNLLQKMGLQVELAENGLIALEKARSQGAFDLVFMDLQMPIMDGFECTRLLKEYYALSGAVVPIIALSANSSDADRKKAMVAGVDGFLSKPVKRQEIEAYLKALQP